MTERIVDTLARDLRIGIFFGILLVVRQVWRRKPHAALKALWILFFLQLAVPVRIPVPVLRSTPVQRETPIPDAVLRLTAEPAYAVPEPARPDFLWGIPELLLLVWGLGVAVLALRAAVRFFLLRRQLKGCIQVDRDVFSLPAGSVPFTLGILHPEIYLPAGLTSRQRKIILQHERAHIRNGDTLLKPAVYLVVVLHWYNPLAWAAYRAFAADLEMACDESVVASVPRAQRLAYAQALLEVLSVDTQNHFCVNAFGGGSVQTVKRRVTNMMECKPHKRGVFLALVLLVAFCTCARAESVGTNSPGPAASSAAESETDAAGEAGKPEEDQQEERTAASSVSYLPAALEDAPLQAYDFGSDAHRSCLREATSDSREYLVVLWSDEGTDTVDLRGAVPSDARQGAASEISCDAIRFAPDALRYESNLPKQDDTILYFNEKGKDYFVYGTFPLEELEKVADGVSVP